MRRSPVGILAIISLAASLAAPSRAGVLTPNGDPVGGPGSAMTADKFYTVSLTPNPALYVEQGNCPWLMPSLKAQGYTAANNWNITHAPAPLLGGFNLDQYFAWADSFTSKKQGPFGPFSEKAPGSGAVFGLTYKPVTTNVPQGAMPDPTGAGLHWIQVIRANDADATQKKFGADAGGGFTMFLDNGWKGNTLALDGSASPFYDGDYANPPVKGGFTANASVLYDDPSSKLFSGLDVEFQSFIATEKDTKNDAGKTIHNVTIYDGVWWGFSAVPEPGSLTLVALGAGIVVLVACRAPSKAA
jgi:hypothetical protein